tara:strand:- start:122 stop:379 length:258 start_codon:yes stop_codon:yes gene_type:complete
MSLKKSRTILEELQQISVDRDRHHVLENRVENVVSAVQNLRQMLQETYSEQDALDLERRLINSIKSGDPKKFSRGIKKVLESKEN